MAVVKMGALERSTQCFVLEKGIGKRVEIVEEDKGSFPEIQRKWTKYEDEGELK